MQAVGSDSKEEIAMGVRKWGVAVLALGLGWSVPAYGQLPAYQPTTLAQTIARTLKESGQLVNYRVDVTAQDGIVDLVGEVADANQRAIVSTIARATPGGVMGRDWRERRAEA